MSGAVGSEIQSLQFGYLEKLAAIFTGNSFVFPTISIDVLIP
jgi:hypothetical protein